MRSLYFLERFMSLLVGVSEERLFNYFDSRKNSKDIIGGNYSLPPFGFPHFLLINGLWMAFQFELLPISFRRPLALSFSFTVFLLALVLAMWWWVTVLEVCFIFKSYSSSVFILIKIEDWVRYHLLYIIHLYLCKH